MKKRFFALLLSVLMLFSSVAFTVSAATETEEFFEFEYLKRDISTGDGYVVVEFSGNKVTLKGDRDTTQIPKGEKVKVTIKAQIGSAVTAVAYDNIPMNFGDPASELNMTIENYKSNHSLKITYDAQTFNCSVSSVGSGNVEIIDPATDRASVNVSRGENFMFYAEAQEGEEILAIKVNGKDIDLTNYGQTDVIRITRFQLELPEICEDTEVFVTFSGEKAEYVTVTVDWNEGGICNGGKTTAQVLKGNMFELEIEPESGYRVAKITDCNKVVTNFTGDVYYATDVKEDRKITVYFEEIPEGAIFGDVNSDGKVNVIDATNIQKAVAGLLSFDAEQSYYGDVDGDTRITVKDATAVQKHTAGIITVFPVETK